MRYLPAIFLLLLGLAFGAAPLLTPDFGGFEPDQFPIPQTDPPVQPAGYAFAIWSVIYLWLIAGLIFGLLRRADDPAWAAMRVPLGLSIAVGALWLSVALQSPAWATVLIWVMWVGAVLALRRAPEFDRGWAEGPVGLYAGWLTAAACVSLGLMAAGYGVMPDIPAALLSLALAVILTARIMAWRPGAWSFGFAVIWALVAVIVRNWPETSVVWGLAAAGVGVVLVILIIQREEIRA